MKYSELERKLLKFGCYPTGEQQHGHPLWFSPTTGRRFATSNHKGKEVAIGTLKSIMRDSGLK